MNDNEIIRNRWIELSRNHSGWSISVSSRGEESPAGLVLSGFGFFLWLWIPPIIPPYREKVMAQTWDAATVARMGRDWYWNIDPRRFGLSLWDGHFSVYYGRQANSSLDDQQWGCFLPRTEWRFVRHSLYGLGGEEVWSQRRDGPGRRSFDALYEARKTAPARVFAFKDFDGEEINCTTRIEEREWLRGDKWCKWLSRFYAPKVIRSLDLEFSKGTGRRKGSWTGGTIGHSIEMLPGELHESAFRRYCAQNNMTLIGEVGRD